MQLSGIGRLFRLDGRRALVTGASNGMGRAIALALAEFGADVAIQYLDTADRAIGAPETGASTGDEILAMGRRATLIDLDLRTPGAPDHVFARAVADLGGIDILVLAAAIQFRTPWTEIGAEALESQIAVNFAA